MQAAERQVRRPGGHEKLRALWNCGHTCACRSEEEVEGEWREVRTEGLTRAGPPALSGCAGMWRLLGARGLLRLLPLPQQLRQPRIQ